MFDYEYSPHYPEADAVIALFIKAGIGKPNWTTERIERAMKGSTLVVTAWKEETLIGYISVISDSAWVGYITQLAVDPDFQKRGIGKKLTDLVQEKLGDEVTLIVHSSDTGINFYKSYGFESYSNVFKLNRRR